MAKDMGTSGDGAMAGGSGDADRGDAGDSLIRGLCPTKMVLRRPRRDGWSREARALFLDCLAQTCNVTRAAEAAGRTTTSARALRKRDPAFAKLWDEAIQAGYEHLEAKVLAHALSGNVNAIQPGESGYQDTASFDPEFAMRFLTQYHARRNPAVRKAKPRMRTASMEEVEAILLRRLNALDRRLAKERARAAPSAVEPANDGAAGGAA